MFKKKTQRLIKDHPEIFNAANNECDFSISESDIPDIQWFYDTNQSIIDLKKLPKKRWYLSKRFIAPATAVMIFGIFLGATPTGRAMVHNIYKTVATWNENEVKIVHGVDIPPEKDDIKVDKYTFHSIQEAQDAFDIAIIESSIGKLDLIKVKKTDFNINLSITYALPNDQSILITQDIDDCLNTESYATLDFDEGQIVQVETLDSIEFYGNVDDDGGIALAYKDNLSFIITSENITYDLFVDFIRNLHLINPTDAK